MVELQPSKLVMRVRFPSPALTSTRSRFSHPGGGFSSNRSYVAPVLTWGELSAERPELTEQGKAIFYQYGVGLAFMATTASDGAPRVHPICPLVTAEHLYAFIITSPKQRDLLARPLRDAQLPGGEQRRCVLYRRPGGGGPRRPRTPRGGRSVPRRAQGGRCDGAGSRRSPGGVQHGPLSSHAHHRSRRPKPAQDCLAFERLSSGSSG